MIDLGPHAVFIVWAYLGVAMTVAALVGWTLYDARSTARRLAELEARAPRRAAR
ncbi:MAG: heme exporter protein CcmD [Devosia sp.]|jgi:heme exporter protein CcmD|nr:heme exporter protein CcmD [Alphaproteobacteria bacterium]MBU1562059.1 heme exporter protein CcmD [Alphaproteobacteria bacterium]MBU2301760.1 heme exporter protein CcmD [Alphaproteobacteria bacterium]MBU2369588.1 heme exporter protein CcmD [Alphaproteobacteria bacterium]